MAKIASCDRFRSNRVGSLRDKNNNHLGSRPKDVDLILVDNINRTHD